MRMHQIPSWPPAPFETPAKLEKLRQERLKKLKDAAAQTGMVYAVHDDDAEEYDEDGGEHEHIDVIV
jgi:hypothetical protein